jgi:hypothetical protein
MNFPHLVSALPENDNKSSRTLENLVKCFFLIGPALVFIVFVLVVILIAGDAHAANDDWVKPGVGLVETLQSGLVTFGALFVGLAVIGFAIYTAAQSVLGDGRVNWGKLFTIIIAGVLIMAGPSMMALLLQAVGSA